MKSLFLLIVFIVVSAFVPFRVFAATYGAGNYGRGFYNVGATPTPAPSNSTDANNSGSSGGSASPSAPSCTSEKPASAPDLFQINAQATSVTLYFSPSSGHRDRYFVSYGTTAGSEQYGAEFMNSNNGVIATTVQNLQPKTIYYFKVRAGNGCQPGDWSNSLAVKTGQRMPTYKWTSLSRIVTTNVAQRVKQSSVQQVQLDTSTSSPTPETMKFAVPQNSATPAPSATEQTPITPAASPSLLQRVSHFFTGLFGK